jgi:hypothetical protein
MTGRCLRPVAEGVLRFAGDVEDVAWLDPSPRDTVRRMDEAVELAGQ